MSRTAKDWQKAKQQAQHIRDPLHNLIDEIETLSWEHPDIIEGHHKTRRANQTNILSR